MRLDNEALRLPETSILKRSGYIPVPLEDASVQVVRVQAHLIPHR